MLRGNGAGLSWDWGNIVATAVCIAILLFLFWGLVYLLPI